MFHLLNDLCINRQGIVDRLMLSCVYIYTVYIMLYAIKFTSVYD